mmetsp:Transcript_21133/g.45815  ORF Transcript_21133/g.45815 Transcript_21133/m.45815 type:complete len:834 (+) Transcript_21133:206-2707(+)
MYWGSGGSAYKGSGKGYPKGGGKGGVGGGYPSYASAPSSIYKKESSRGPSSWNHATKVGGQQVYEHEQPYAEEEVYEEEQPYEEEQAYEEEEAYDGEYAYAEQLAEEAAEEEEEGKQHDEDAIDDDLGDWALAAEWKLLNPEEELADAEPKKTKGPTFTPPQKPARAPASMPKPTAKPTLKSTPLAAGAAAAAPTSNAGSKGAGKAAVAGAVKVMATAAKAHAAPKASTPAPRPTPTQRSTPTPTPMTKPATAAPAAEPALEEDDELDEDFDPWAHLAEPEIEIDMAELEAELAQEIDFDELNDELNEAYPGFDHEEEEAQFEEPPPVDEVEEEWAEEKEGPEEKEEKEEKEDESRFHREDDIDLDLVPEDQREAVERNLELKRALSASIGEGSAKRRKTDSGWKSGPQQELSQQVRSLLQRWQLLRDSASSFVLRTGDSKFVAALAKGNWKPTNQPKRTYSEQIYERLTLIKERQGAPGGALDAVSAFAHRWGLNREDDDLLATLDYRSLLYVFREFDNSRPLSEIADEAKELTGEEEDVPAGDKPGLYVMGRNQTLELIDPDGDALVLGDANLTFSLVLAQHRVSLHHTGKTVCTTFEKLDTLQERYPEICETIKTLESMNCEVLHNVDCTRLAVDSRFQGMEGRFVAAYYNFPHAGVVPGFFDGHPFVRWRHANLMHLFFRALRPVMKPGVGTVKVASNSRATGVRYSDIIGGALNSEFVHDETFPFLEWTLSKYRRSYGDRRDQTKRPEDGENYNAQRANSDMVYSFTYRPSGDTPAPPIISFPPTKDELYHSDEGRAGRLPPGHHARTKRVDELYDLFLSYVQGIHIG